MGDIMNIPTPGLRDLTYTGVSVGKAQINVSADDRLSVPEHVAEQLQRQDAAFKDGPQPPTTTAEPKTVEKPAKKPAKKSAAKKTVK